MVKETLSGTTRAKLQPGTLFWTFVCYYAALLPSVSAQQYNFQVQEELQPGAVVGTINIQQGETYSIEGNSPQFALNSQTGVIITISRIDRDSLNTNPIVLQVRTSSSFFSVHVRVEDINDNTPEFSSPVFLVDIFENAAFNSVYSIDSATDIDAAENGTIDYAIVAGNEAGKFKLGRNTTECGGTALCIITQGSLDREKVAAYEINISASDRGKPSLRSYCLVNITILDLNDNDPVFTKNSYNATVDENSPAGVELLAVSATDKDHSLNGEVIYSFDLDSDSNKFDLNSTTGVIRTREPLDYESKTLYTFKVSARDQPQGVPSRQSSQATVEIHVRDLNDNRPQITGVVYANQKNPAEVIENSGANVLVATLFVKDDDDPSGPNGQVILETSNDNGSFKIEFSSILPPNGISLYNLKTAVSLDHERSDFYNITVTVKDRGTPSLNSSVHVLVRVIDVNDEIPSFGKPDYSASVSELARNGSSVYRLMATDLDMGSNGKISYSILSGNALHWFQINSVSGLITTAMSLDREHLSQVSLTVLAKDHGSPPLNSTTVVMVSIDDINDNVPEFSHRIYNVTLAENMNPGTPVITLNATDDDIGSNGNLTYRIDSTSQIALDTFTIGTSSGLLTTKIKLDREVRSMYEIPIIASDQGLSPLSSRTLVRLQVTDVNDNHPVFYPVTYIESILTNAQPRVITQVTATDPDDGTNGQIFYRITSGADSKFAINSSSGEIRTLMPLDSNDKGFYILNVTANDLGGLYAQRAATVEVTVQGQSDDLPEFEHSLYNFTVYENEPSGTYVGKVIAVAKVNSGNILYSIVSGDPQHVFDVDSTGGIIMLDGHVDREKRDKYLLHVVAKARIVHPLSATTSVKIDVLDRNDNPPLFSSSSAQVTIDASWPVGKEIYLASATDKDAGLNGAVGYKLTFDGNGLLKVNTTSGMVSLSRKVNSLDDPQYLIQVSASDQGAPPLRSTFMLTVVIVTNHQPRFLLPSFNVSVPRNLPVGKDFLPVMASDPDEGDNGKLTYAISLIGNELDLFAVSPDGILFVKNQLNQARSLYTLSVTATDKGSPPLLSSVSVTVNIRDSIQYQPIFANDTVAFSVLENQLPGTMIGRLPLRDDAFLKSKKMIYSLPDHHDNFVINPVTGIITTVRPFDREQLVEQSGKNVFVFLAKATYSDSRSKQDTAVVVVTVEDQNDNIPEFRHSVLFVTVEESTPVGSIVYKVLASDPDEGVNANFTFLLMSGPNSKVFSIDPVHGNLFLNHSLDREKVDHYTLTVQAMDTYNRTMFSQVHLEIIVGDANDNEPEFTEKHLTVNVSENLAVSSLVAMVQAADKDAGENSEIAYTITSGNLEAVFDINHLTGEVFLSKPLNYERTQKYTLNITADDRGNPPKSTVSLLSIYVIDENDNPPVFTDQPSVIRMLENVTSGSLIGHCSATDFDSGKNGRVTYGILSQTPPEEMAFEVNPVTCAITTRRILDRETTPQYKIVIRAVDSASPGPAQLSATKEVTILLQDVNDNKPRFATAPAVGINGNEDPNTVVMTILATDTDTGSNAKVTYNIVGDKSYFRLDANTGQLVTRLQLPGNRLNYQLRVSAHDNGAFSQVSETLVTLFKKGQPNSGPIFKQALYRGFVEENSRTGTSVTQVEAEFSPSKPGADVKYYMTADSSNGSFAVNENSGDITTAVELDRDSVLTSVFTLIVYAVDLSGPSARTSSTTVEITVRDKNDNSPIFMQSTYIATVMEQLPPGASVATVSAVDKDQGLNAQVHYSIIGAGSFQINITTGEITTQQVLNRTVQDEYNLTVFATDGGSPARNSSCVVMVTVKDSNDNAPQFDRLFYDFNIFEETAVGAIVGTVMATDSDVGENARISYSIVGNHRDVFLMDPFSGHLKVAGALDRETVEIYILSVSATDHGNPRKSAYAEVYVSVLDRNDNAPVFSKSMYHVSISEAVAKDSSIITVSATDKDFGTNGGVTYTILAGNNDRTFGIYPNGTMYNLKTFDRERKRSYQLSVLARDHAKPVAVQLSSTAAVQITITDINDNSPYFISGNVTHVSEHAVAGDVITTIMVADADAGSNGKVTFGLVKLDAFAPFSVGAADGVLRVSGSLDREVRDSYVVKVIATDQGVPAKRTEKKLTIIVDDYNDHAPVFQSGMSQVPVFENISIGSEVARFVATDSDQGSNAEIRYSIAAGNENGSFEIDPSTGVISTIKSLDRENTPSYILAIRASDLGIPPQFTDKSLSIFVRDVNDNTPTFTKGTYTPSVFENDLVASVVTVKAVDNDEGRNGALTYEIIRGNDGGSFTINPQTGQIGLTIALDREKQAKHTLKVQAKDGGTPPRVGEAMVIVGVKDRNDNPPVFQPDFFKASVKETSGVDTPVLQITATDADTGANSKITYSLSVSFASFAIDASTGQVKTTAILDRETTSSFELNVLATDGGIPPQTGKATLLVNVEDVNDFDPAFLSDRYTGTVSPGAAPGTFIIMVSAADNDIGPNAESEYTVPTTLPPVFQISPKTGIITVAQNVPSSPSSYTFTVQAANVNSPLRTDTTDVQINVLTGSFPVFQHQDQNITVSELAPVGTEIFNVNATGHISYFIAAGNTGDVFDIDKLDGELRILKPLDFEQQKSYAVIVGARGAGIQSLSSFVTIRVLVTDENDNPPQFNQSVYRVQIQEELPENTTVLWVHASDADSGPNAAVEYKIVPANSLASATFQVSLKAGCISTSVKLDRENTSLFTFKVRAENVANRSLADEAFVIVSVQDINDNVPVFIDPMTASVYENVSTGFRVAVLSATDADTPSNAQLRFGFAPGGNPGGVFNLDANNGSLTIQNNLNREHRSQYVLQVTVGDSLHTVTSNFTVIVLDVNDNPPRFVSDSLSQTIKEKLPIGSEAMNVTAHDDDIGTNAVILYSILPSFASDVFTVDRQTGVLRLNKELLYKKPSPLGNENLYNITVRARNPYSPFFEATVHVVVEVTDANDHSPLFTPPLYSFFVFVNTRNGETIGRVEATDEEDEGVNARVRYEIISGNGSALFRLDSDSGNVTVAGNIATPGVFFLRIKAEDSGDPSKESEADVYVEVVERNNHSPTFPPQYQASKLETLPVGSEVLTVTAEDKDSGTNGQVSYRIESANPPGYFGVGERNGSIYVQKSLDYELTRLFILNVVGTDGGKIPRSDSVEVRITLLDANDNRPIFTQKEYHGYVPENTSPGAPVVSVTALDPDQGLGGNVEYSFTSGGSAGLFEINRFSGKIMSSATFDYEVEDMYALTVTARDQGNPQLESQPSAKVLVHVTSVNEYPPRFNKSLFQASVAENAPIGQSVTQIYASDQDKGPDGEVIFVLVGESNFQGFKLDRLSGVLSVSGKLDNERAGMVTLQVLAKNALQTSVTPETTDVAKIIVTVTDANDAPRFLQSVYNARVMEGAISGSFVTNVSAVDDDFAKSPVEARIRYGILTGNIENAFTIDPDSGAITTLKSLDRELVPQYLLTVTATDQGRPPMSGNATVIVRIDDINDNAPRLPGNCVGRVREKEPAGSQVITLTPHDPDVDPNRGPYTFVIDGTPNNEFHLDRRTGLITTTVELDREATASYNLSIRISDGGSPQQSAVSYCEIQVQDVNDNPPRQTARIVHVNINNSLPSGDLAKVQPEDPDVNDLFVCEILQDSNGLFGFAPGSCVLRTKNKQTGSMVMDLIVNGSDGKWAVSYDVQVRFVAFNLQTFANSLTVRVQNTSPKGFLSQSYQKFLNAINVIFSPLGYNSQLFSIKSVGGGLVDLTVAAKKTEAFEYLRREELSTALRNNKANLERNGNVSIQNVDYTPCTASSPCQNGGECTSYMHNPGTITTLESTPVIFLSVDYEWRFRCVCKPGFGGETCGVSEQGCNLNPCKNGATCIDKDSSFSCQCPSGFTGQTCSDDVNECEQKPCKNNGTCKNLVGSYQCDCKPGYLGKNCSSGYDYCRVASVASWATPRCTCSQGQLCQCSCIGFESASYLQLPTLESLQQDNFNNITFEFASSQSNSLLLYNHDGQNKVDSDFIAIQIVGGKLRLSFNLGDTRSPVVVQAKNFVADGKWHTVMAIRNRKVSSDSLLSLQCNEVSVEKKSWL